MNTLQSIQDVASIKVLLYVTSSILIVFVGIIGYFLSRRDSAIFTATENLTSAVIELKIIVKSQQVQHEIRQPMIDASFELHRKSIAANSDRIENLDSRLVRLETEHSMFACKFKENIKSFQV